MVLVYGEQERRSTRVVGEGRRPSLARCTIHTDLGRKATTAAQIYAGAVGAVASLSGQHGRRAFLLVLSLHELVIAPGVANLVFILMRDPHEGVDTSILHHYFVS
jgi:hypothetical protein